MRVRHSLLLVFVIGCLSTGNLFGYILGPDPGVNGVFGASLNCTTGCHNSFPVNSGTGGVTITGLPTSWTPGQTYPLTVSVQAATSPTSRVYGFQLSSVVDSTGKQAGTLAKVNATVQVICGAPGVEGVYPGINCAAAGAIQFAEHTNAGTPSNFLVNWTAPADASIGAVRFNVAGNAGNGDSTNQGDHIYTKVYTVSPLAVVDLSVHAFTMVDHGGISIITDGSGALNAGYARIQPSSGTTPSGVAIFGERVGGTLVTEAGVPASAPLQNGRIYAEVGPGGFNGLGTDIGLAIANPGGQAAAITFTLTNASGIDVGSGVFNLAAGNQTASFLDQAPWNAPAGFQGTFSFNSSVPISVVALEGFRNQRNEFLITTLPVIDTTVATNTSPVVLPHYTDGTGWSTYILLVNPGDTTLTGTIQFRDQNGTVVALTANGQTSNSFAYSIPRRSSFKLTTAGGGAFKSGSVTVTPGGGTNAPVSLAVFSYGPGGLTVSQAGVPSNSATNFRMFVEGTPGRTTATPGSYSSGFAVANSTANTASVTFQLFTLAGADTGLTNTVQIPAFGQAAEFIEDLFPALPLPFQGVMRISTSAPISVVGLRIRYNERPGEFLMTTTPPTNENAATTTAEADFPHILNGGGYTTQFVLFSGIGGQVSAGNLSFFTQGGAGFNLNVN
jgi:hypothetical protein